MDKMMRACLFIIKAALVIGFVFGLICLFGETPETSGIGSQVRLWITGALICLGCGAFLAFIQYEEER